MAKRARRAAGEQVGRGRVPQLRKVRKDGWTAARRRIFLDELARTCNVTAAARKAKMSETAPYSLRRRSAEFRAEWRQALSEGYARIELLLLERFMNGTVKTVRRGDAIVETVEYPNAIALALLRMHKASVQEFEAEHAPEELEEVRKRIGRKLDALRRRVEAEEAKEAGPDGSAGQAGAADEQ